MITPRRRARQFAVQALYQAQLNTDASADAVARHVRDNDLFAKADEALFSTLFFGAHSNRAAYMAEIRPLLDRDENDLNPVEKAVLLMAYHELAAMPETPYPVIINEAIEITKTYGGTDGYKFVNGILDKLAAQLRPNDPPRR
ncbi:N utilization substance protein B [Neisseria sp. HSC-16F19]|nr:transcription antitermination factor NusB [Neisseria sp. HSC-16F19]MCP2040214.1 N utilization substance protein B [Neisseria sp. HSC-16F19]